MTKIEIGGGHQLTIQDVDLISKKEASLFLSQDQAWRTHIQKGAHFIENTLHQEGVVYGVTTGYGDSCTRPVPLELVPELPLHLTRFHGCGLGNYLSAPQTRAVLAVRLASLCQGVSGVSLDLLKRLELLLSEDILPLIPSEGSVGASGDLTPLSYIAGVIVGERRVLYQGKIYKTADIYKKLKIVPYTLRPKEALALMNGTAVMTALAAEAMIRADYLGKLSSRLTAMTSLALKGNPNHFDEILFKAKPHPGQNKIAKWIRQDLKNTDKNTAASRLQDRYSTRCAPHIIGILEDMKPSFSQIIETEINSANDNPLIDLEGKGRILHGGHFYGGHIAFVMDGLKNIVANIADLLDRQMATLVDPKFNNGLPANLSGATGERACINHGLKALQIGASAWCGEALKGTMPASVFSRSTESHNQDKVSMGTIAARDALRVLELTEQVAASQLFASLQALRLREKEGTLSENIYTRDMTLFLNEAGRVIPFIEEDVALDEPLRKVVTCIQERCWGLYDE